MVTGNGQLRHALRERSAAAARFPHAYGGLLPARPGTPGIYFEYSRKLVPLVGLVCCFLGASGAADYFLCARAARGGPWAPYCRFFTIEHTRLKRAVLSRLSRRRPQGPPTFKSRGPPRSFSISKKQARDSRGSRGGYPLVALGSEDWCDAIHAGVFLTADRQCTELPLLRLPRLVPAREIF